MISEILKEITLWFTDLGYWGIFLACLGIFPAEIVIAMAGAIMPQNILEIATVAALGEVAGAYITYLVGYYFSNKDFLKFLTEGKGKVLGVNEKSYNEGYKSVREKGVFYVLMSRFVPWLRVVTTLIGGYVKLNIPLFSLAVFGGTIVYGYAFAYLGAEIGFNWDQIKKIIDTFNNASLGIIFLGIFLYVYINRKKLLNNGLLNKIQEGFKKNEKA
ncbi:MAG TPA: VTT domain-containing protein [Candidatus Dojkabacteria bacterium]|nr:VTT domain-containing protein [Candidatus Dojkabacteria bacterium]